MKKYFQSHTMIKVLILLVFLVVLCACSMLPTLHKKPVETKTDSVILTPVEETKKKMQKEINKIKGVDNEE